MKTAEQIQLQIDKHEKAIEILEAIQSFYRKIKLKQDSINGFAGTFPRLKANLLNDIDTLEKCIKRISDNYKRNF